MVMIIRITVGPKHHLGGDYHYRTIAIMQEIIVKLVVSVFRKAALILGNNNSSPHVDEDVIVVITTTKQRLRELTGCQGILATQGQLLR